LLKGVHDCLMFPPADPSLDARSALGFELTGLAAGPVPVAVQDQALFDRRHVADEPLPGRAAIDVLVGQIGKVLLAEAAVGLGTRRLGLAISSTGEVVIRRSLIRLR
jgi:hypothetical protein